MRIIASLVILSCFMALTGCEKRTADEPQRTPGQFFHTGGDTVTNHG